MFAVSQRNRSLVPNLILLAVVAIVCTQARALPIHVILDWPADRTSRAADHVHIEAVRTIGRRAADIPVKTEVDSDGAILNLGEGVWHIQASVSGYWCQGIEVVISSRTPAELRLALWPAASFQGQITTAAGEPSPEALDVLLTPTPLFTGKTTAARPTTQTPAPSPLRADIHCPITAGIWSCVGPAGLFDMRLEASGYAPRYEWGVTLIAGQSSNLGQTELRRAASVFGRAVRKDGSEPPGPCQGSLKTSIERRGPGDPDSENVAGSPISLSVPLTQRGYFQFIGVLPGLYELSVQCQSASEVRELRIQTDGETRIDPPLSLQELTLEIAVTPKVDPEGRPWQLVLDETSPQFRRIADKSTTSADGRWTRQGLRAGNYHVLVRSSDGTLWHQRYFDLGPSGGSLPLQLASMKVAGRVRLSSQPVRARLTFSNNAGGERTTLTSNDDGRFQGLLPVLPGAQTTTWTVEAHVTAPSVHQQLLGIHVQPTSGGTWLDLDLPVVAVRGSVFSQDGQPQRDAEVIFEDSKGARTTTATDSGGRFEMPDLRPGKYSAVAQSAEGISDRSPFEVAEGIETELKLVLNPSQRVSFQVVSSDGPVMDAAAQVWTAPGVPQAFARTDENGRFQVKLPPGTAEVGLTVGKPGYAIKLMRIPIPNASDDSPETQTITLESSGGKLVLNFQQAGRPDDPAAALFLVHNRTIQDARTVAGWGAVDQAGASGKDPGVVDAIDPGDYALCRMDPNEVATLWQGQLPSNRCRKGSLDRDGILTLSPPP